MIKNNHFTFRGFLKSVILEYKYYMCKNWSIYEVGKFWDSVSDYNDINEETYTYFRRFTNSYVLAKEYIKPCSIMLDIQARSGKGSLFWHEKGYIKKSFLVDFSDYMLSIANELLKSNKLDYELIKISQCNLPFENDFFDLVVSYETIEHISENDKFIRELTRVLKPEGTMIITCPNIIWEPIHWVSTIFNIHHSEGPHNFLRRNYILKLFARNGLTVLKENTTILLPFNNKYTIKVNEFLEKYLFRKS